MLRAGRGDRDGQRAGLRRGRVDGPRRRGFGTGGVPRPRARGSAGDGLGRLRRSDLREDHVAEDDVVIPRDADRASGAVSGRRRRVVPESARVFRNRRGGHAHLLPGRWRAVRALRAVLRELRVPVHAEARQGALLHAPLLVALRRGPRGAVAPAGDADDPHRSRDEVRADRRVAVVGRVPAGQGLPPQEGHARQVRARRAPALRLPHVLDGIESPEAPIPQKHGALVPRPEVPAREGVVRRRARGPRVGGLLPRGRDGLARADAVRDEAGLSVAVQQVRK
mmetsp:Transcript_19967/g.61533  ORF Transcript_19967/g.61533 Transcript_19967/m.61533 type:complete len:281 (-) Transcript_19967:16-858(-)